MIHEADVDRVGDQLDQAINSLVESGVQPTGVDELREAVRLLEDIRVSAVSHPPSPVLAAALRDLVPRAARAGELLDSAAAFYRGWLQVSPAPAEDYAPDGAWASTAFRSSAGGVLSIQA
jgi:Arc/MetJ-type ribon-helix-helix transcriptional regulator